MAAQTDYNVVYKMLLEHESAQDGLMEIPRGRRARAAIDNRNKTVLRIIDALNPAPVVIVDASAPKPAHPVAEIA